MAELEKRIREIRRRLILFTFANLLSRSLLIGLMLALVYLIVHRLIETPWDPLVITGGLVGASAIGAAIWTYLRRVSLIEAAVAADDALGLRERLSSALLLKNYRDDVGAIEALQVDAASHAQAIRPGKDFKFKMPRMMKHLLWPLAAFVAVYMFMPQFDLLAKPAPSDPMAEATDPAAKEKMRQEQSREIRELAKKAREVEEDLKANEEADFAKELERLSEDYALGTRDKRAAVAELSRLEDEVKMEKQTLEKKAEPFKQIQGLQRADKTREMQQDLKNQDFSEAAAKMETMASEQLQQMNSQETEQLAQELENLAEELKENEQLSEQLQQASEALQQAAEAKKQQEQQGDQQQDQQQQQGQQQQQQAQQQGQQQGQQSQQSQQQQQQQAQQQQGSQQQQQQGGQQGQQQQQAQQQSGSQQGQQGQQQQQAQQAMAQAQQQMQQAAQQMQNQQQLMQQMAQLDQLSQQLAQQRSSMLNQSGQQGSQSSGQQGQAGQSGQSAQPGGQQPGETAQPSGQPCASCGGAGCSSCGGQGAWKEGYSTAQSLGSGGPGRGKGHDVPDAGPQSVQFIDDMIKGEKNDGEILAVIEIDAPAEKGESNVRYTQIYNTRAQQAADSMTRNEIPLGYRNVVRDYFEAINPQKRAE